MPYERTAVRPNPTAVVPGAVVNAMTIDVEDYFHVSAFAASVSRDAWSQYESRVAANTDRLLALFADTGVRATFFVLGWVAERDPGLVRRIVAAGHEVASHSYWHQLVYDLDVETFRHDLRRAKHAIEDAAGVMVRGFRAPSYSLVERSLWALDVLVEEGYSYDASVFPIRHDRYGIPQAPRHAHRIARAGGSVIELPGTTAIAGGARVPIGGGYFRLLPYRVTRWAVEKVNTVDLQPAMFYLHPWEIDPDQPRLQVASAISRWRHYNNLAATEPRLRRLLADFRWGAVEDVWPVAPASRPASAATVVPPAPGAPPPAVATTAVPST
jgi:polysaccharide deacetylase family protein (PEP-CTERM system associated)